MRQGEDLYHSHSLSTDDIAEILLAAQNSQYDIDLLFYLGFEKGRWDAVVWLVKTLVEKFGAQLSRPSRLSQTLCSWVSERPLRDLLRRPVHIDPLINSAREVSQSGHRQSLAQLTDTFDPGKTSRHELLQRNALGQVWRSIGLMTIACADGAVKPEILEIIAYLHHMEIMPRSIYNAEPSEDVTAIQHPPMLNLLSSRILVSLSDAAWRAHAKLVVDEFKAKGRTYESLRPEIPGMAYRVHVDGLRPEVWLELILWSCLRGGWILEGASILSAVTAQKVPRMWKPVSWRTFSPDASPKIEDWEKLQYMFSTHKISSLRDSHPTPTASINRTISSEVVNAYVDALLSTVRVGVGDRGAGLGEVIAYLSTFQRFLKRSMLSLGAGSWNAIILRLVDTQDSVLHQPKNLEQLVSLAPALGEDLSSRNVQDLPPYVLDGSALVLGLFHQALRAKIRAGDIRGSLRLFEFLQMLADKNKRNSVVDFWQKWRFKDSKDELFTSNYSGVDYPALDVQIPATILGPFFDLVCNAKAYNFGKWLLYSDEIDGPVLPKHMYGDHAILPALVRFAAESQDKDLLSALVRIRVSHQDGDDSSTSPKGVLLSFLDSQINLRRWDAAIRVLQRMREFGYSCSVHSFANLGRAMLMTCNGANSIGDDSTNDGDQAKELFSNVLKGEYEEEARYEATQKRMTQIMTIIAMIDEKWAQFCKQLLPLPKFDTVALGAQAFNPVLEGIVESYGSVMGRRILGLFWSHAVRDSQKAGERRSTDASGEFILRGGRRSQMEDVDRRRAILHLPGDHGKTILYGGLQPNVMTIRIILNKTIEEYKQAGKPEPAVSEEVSEGINKSHLGMIAWATRCLPQLGMAKDDLREEIKEKLSGELLADVETKLPDLFQGDNAEPGTITKDMAVLHIPVADEFGYEDSLDDSAPNQP